MHTFSGNYYNSIEVRCMLKRKFMNDLLEWKNTQSTSKTKQCLLVKGARQVGKSTLIEEFGRTYYDNFISVDFRKEKELRTIFDDSFDIKFSDWKIQFIAPRHTIHTRQNITVIR